MCDGYNSIIFLALVAKLQKVLSPRIALIDQDSTWKEPY